MNTVYQDFEKIADSILRSRVHAICKREGLDSALINVKASSKPNGDVHMEHYVEGELVMVVTHATLTGNKFIVEKKDQFNQELYEHE